MYAHGGREKRVFVDVRDRQGATIRPQSFRLFAPGLGRVVRDPPCHRTTGISAPTLSPRWATKVTGTDMPVQHVCTQTQSGGPASRRHGVTTGGR
jgi:hypothetical protein